MGANAGGSGTGLAGRRVLLCVTGGIAAYKAVELARRLGDAGAEVQVAMTEAATRFVGAQTFQAVTHRPVRTSLWDASAEAAMGHLELARWAQQVVVAPAMNHRMWLHSATQANVDVLRERGALVIGPDDGPLAEGESGPGRLSEPGAIVAALAAGTAGYGA